MDSVNDYTANEVALDYNSVFVGAVAGLYSAYGTGMPVDPTTIPEVKGSVVDSDYIPPVSKPSTNVDEPEDNDKPITVQVEAGSYTICPDLSNSNFDGNYPGWNWSVFEIPDDETAERVEVTISSDSVIGTWNGAFGSTINDSDWFQSSDFNDYFNSNTATEVWYIDPDTAEIIKYKDGDLKVGFWWTSNNNYKIDSVTVYTNKTITIEPETTTAETTTIATTTTSSETETTTTSTSVATETETTTTTTVSETEAAATTTEDPESGISALSDDYSSAVTEVSIWGDANSDGEVDIADAVLIMQAIANPDAYGLNGSDPMHITAQGVLNADVYETGASGVTAEDALHIQKFRLRIVKSLNPEGLAE